MVKLQLKEAIFLLKKYQIVQIQRGKVAVSAKFHPTTLLNTCTALPPLPLFRSRSDLQSRPGASPEKRKRPRRSSCRPQANVAAAAGPPRPARGATCRPGPRRRATYRTSARWSCRPGDGETPSEAQLNRISEFLAKFIWLMNALHDAFPSDLISKERSLEHRRELDLLLSSSS